MVILNTTFMLHHGIESDAIDWIKRAYAPSAYKCGAVESPIFTRVISPAIMQADERTYALHLPFPTMEQAQKWNDGVGASLRSLMSKRWGEKALALPTYLEVIE